LTLKELSIHDYVTAALNAQNVGQWISGLDVLHRFFREYWWDWLAKPFPTSEYLEMLTMDKLQRIRRNLCRVFNSRSGRVFTLCTLLVY